MVLRNVATNFTFEQQRVEINEIASDLNSLGTAISSGNLTLTGYLRGPSQFTIDPANHGDNTGEVVIAGNLTVNGTTTTINSTTLSVDDKIVQLGAVGTPTDATANGGGIVLKGASDKTFLFDSTEVAWISSLKIKSTNGFEGDVTGTATGNAVLTGSTNNTIPTVTGANALTGEANLTFNGSGDFTVKGNDATSANLYLIGHAGDTNGDGWRVGSNQDVKDLTIANNASGSYVDKLTVTADKLMLSVDLKPDTHNTKDFGTNNNRFKDAYFGGTVTSGSLIISDDNALHFKGATDSDYDSILRESSGNALLINSRHIAKLNIDSNGDSTDAYFAVAHGAATSSSTELFRVQENGNVGIGNDNPLKRLHLIDTGDVGIMLQTTAAVDDKESWEITCGANASNNADLVFQTRANDGTGGNVGLRICYDGEVLIGTSTKNTSDRFTIVDPGDAFMSLRSDAQADGNSQVIDFAVGTGDRGSDNLVSTITAAIPNGATAGGTLKGYLAFSSNAGDSLSERVRINEYGNLVVGVNPTTSSSGSGKHNVPLVVYGPASNAVNLMIGNSANGTTSLGANDYSGDIRFNGADVAWGDISYYPNGDGSNGSFRFTRNGSTVATNGNATIGCGAINAQGTIKPINDDSYDLGTATLRWRNVYTADLQMNNTGTGGNEVDGSEGHWTMQEGSDDLFLINRNTGKKYKFNLTEVS